MSETTTQIKKMWNVSTNRVELVEIIGRDETRNLVQVRLPSREIMWADESYLEGEEAYQSCKMIDEKISKMLSESPKLPSPIPGIVKIRAKAWDAWDIPFWSLIFGVKINFQCGKCSQWSKNNGLENQYGYVDRVHCQICGAVNYL